MYPALLNTADLFARRGWTNHLRGHGSGLIFPFFNCERHSSVFWRFVFLMYMYTNGCLMDVGTERD